VKMALCATIGITALSLVACSKGSEEKTPVTTAPNAKFRNSEKPKLKYHTDSSSSSVSPVLEFLKNNHLEVSSTKTIGEAFDGYTYASKKEWRETQVPNGPFYIDYICWPEVSSTSLTAIKQGLVKRKLEIKFVIHKDGNIYIAMARRIDFKSDGMEYEVVIEPAVIKTLVRTIYENREIAF